MKVAFKQGKHSFFLSFMFSKNWKVSFEMFKLNYIRDLLKGKMKWYFSDKRVSTRLKPGSGRQKIELTSSNLLRIASLFIKQVRIKTIRKYRFRKVLKRAGYLK